MIRVHAKNARPLLPFMNGPHDILARGRPSVAIDAKSEAGRAALLDLIDTADALIEGFRPGVLERLGLGPRELHAANPALVIGRMTGYGQDGPFAPRAGHDINYIALSGALAAIGPAGHRPTPPINLVGDFGGGGMPLALGVVSAVLSARATGRLTRCAIFPASAETVSRGRRVSLSSVTT